MNFLNVCQDTNFLSTILFCKRLFELICILVPIGLILMLAIEVGKIVLNPDPKIVKTATSNVVKKIIAAVAIFFVPTLVNLLLGLLGNTELQATEC